MHAGFFISIHTAQLACVLLALKKKNTHAFEFIHSYPQIIFFRTPFHADVFRSHSWSANVCGRKKWYLVRPGSEEKLQYYWKEESSSNGRPTISMTDIRPILEKYPELIKDGEVFEIIQEPGELIFVPSNWHHQVHNLVSLFFSKFLKYTASRPPASQMMRRLFA
jgi:hypothetical protein